MIATLKKTSVKYNGSSTGTGTMKVLKSDIELIDKETKADLSNYLAVDKNGYVNVTKNLNTFVSLITVYRLQEIIKTMRLLVALLIVKMAEEYKLLIILKLKIVI